MNSFTIRSRQGARLGRRGFSLAELLVGLAIIALLAAALIPAVVGQIGKGDATRALSDITSIRTGIEQFVADVHKYPKLLTHLTSPITNAMRDVDGTLYPTNLATRWKGPYLARDATGGFVTGFGAMTLDSLMKLTYQAGVFYVTLRVAPMTQADFDRLDIEIDGVLDPAAGLLRWDNDTLRFLTMPIQ